MTPKFATPSETTLLLHLVGSSDFDNWLAGQDDRTRTWVKASGFMPSTGKSLLVPDADGGVACAVAGIGSAAQRARGRFVLGAIAAGLPAGAYQLANMPADLVPETECLGWLLSSYVFDRYNNAPRKSVDLVAPDGVDVARVEAIAAGEALTRDLINTPASDMGPNALETACELLAAQFAADIDVTKGAALLEGNLPMIHAVGRASDIEPRLIDMRWGTAGPKLTLVGKGVCFDTGGLNLKPGASMGLMKKDMGGSATVLGLARMIMALNLPLQLRVLIPAVENSVSAGAFRPGDILTSRKGLTVEINNTDAEGRLVLADALTLAAEEDSDLVISMATLTGAARVAVGPDLAPFYSDDAFAAALTTGANAVADPVWRMPFWEPYEAMIEPGIADLDNAPKGGFAGSITAALFLRRFVDDTTRYAHFDIFGWQPASAPARPKGGVGQGARAILAALPELLGL